MLVSGGAAVTPYTTPEAAAAQGLEAGNTLTAIRRHLLDAGLTVFTAPASLGGEPVVRDAGWQGFDQVPVVLPADVTVNSVGTIDDGGTRLHAFLLWLAGEYRLDEVDIVAHSMGGLFSRAAIRDGRDGGGPAVRRLITLGTPWTGSLLGDYIAGDVSLDDAHGDPTTVRILSASDGYARANSQGAAAQVSSRYLTGPAGWNALQDGVLSGIEVTAVAGDHLAAAAAPSSLWPHDGLVARRSALAEAVPADVLPARVTAVFPDVHSIFFADLLGLPWDKALTWDPAVLDLLARTLAPAPDPA